MAKQYRFFPTLLGGSYRFDTLVEASLRDFYWPIRGPLKMQAAYRSIRSRIIAGTYPSGG
jgi:hypothetical protein